MIGLRVDEGLFSAIGMGAKDQGISLTSFARLLIAQALGHFEEVPLEAPRRKARRKSISSEQRKAVQALALLGDIHSRLNELVQRSKARSFKQHHLCRQDQTWEISLRKAQSDIAAIRTHLLGGAR